MSSAPPDPTPPDVRPLVGRPPSNLGVWLFVGAVTIAGGLLFQSLEARRESVAMPAIAPIPETAGAMIAPPPDLSIPPEYDLAQEPPARLVNPQYGIGPAQPSFQPIAPRAAAAATPSASAAQSPSGPAQVSALPAISGPTFRPRLGSESAGPETVFDARSGRGPTQDTDANTGKPEERVKAFRFANPSTTVPKGVVIQAVLETALDSTRPGFARAITSRDIFGFDGTRVLIPRGSRLIGEYKADLAAGQKRALIQWQRLMRPDGVVIYLDSPSADPLGQAGVKGSVNTHFFARFGGAFLQSALSVGTQVAVNKLSDGTVIYAIPLATQVIPPTSPDQVKPTLKVKQGTSVSVFVARDLDFTSVDR